MGMPPADNAYEGLLRTLILARLRIVGAAGMVLMLLFSRLDAVVYPAHWFSFLLIRIAVSVFFVCLIALSFHKASHKRAFLLSDLMVFSAAAAICAMIYLSKDPGSDYYEGLNLTFLALFTMNSFRPRHHAITGLTIIACYIIAATGNPGRVHPEQFVSALFFMGSTLLFVTLTAKFFGRQHYDQYVKNEAIQSKNQELEDAYQRLRQNEKLKNEFFANVSHELRTPLTLILGPLESLLTEPKENDPKVQGLLRTLYRNALRLLQMINGLLDFSKLEAGKMEVRREPFEVVSAAKAIVHDFRPLAGQKGLTLTFRPAQPKAVVQMDRYLYDRILFNLISNAVKFTERGEIAVRLSAEKSALTLEVQDTGIGIPEDQLPQLFEKFRQIEGSSTRRFEGTGLGLSLVKEFVRLLQGTVSVSSVPGKGTRFTVTLTAPPAKAGAVTTGASESRHKLLPPAEHPREVTSKLSKEASSVKKGKVLIAEDNQELAAYMGSLLEPVATVRYAENGKKALETALEWHPDIILSDIMMPEMNGLDLCRAVKKDRGLSRIPVVLLTALTHREALLEGWDAGADEYLFKPFHPAELITRIRSLLNTVMFRREAENRRRHEAEEIARLQTELEQLELFSFVASHDLQEPLHSLMALSSFLQHTQAGSENEEQMECLRQIDVNARQMQQYVADVLKFARIGSAQSRNFRPVDLNAVFDGVLESLKPQIAETNARIKKDTLPRVQSDPAQMEQLFKNLIANAIKFHRPKASPEIRIRYKEEENMHVLIFEDKGIGFNEGDAGNIFKPFFRLQKNKIKGSGIGLAICEKIVRRHGGQITAHSSPKAGTSFEVRLPRDPGRAQELQTALSNTSENV